MERPPAPEQFLAHEAWVAPGARVLGAVVLEAHASLWFNATLDGRLAPVTLRAAANVQDNCVVQGVPEHPAVIGARVSMGHNARVIGAVVEDEALIAMGASVLPGARVGTLSIVAAMATVLEDQQVPPRSLVVGQGRVVRQTTDAEIERIRFGGREYVRLRGEYATGAPAPERP